MCSDLESPTDSGNIFLSDNILSENKNCQNYPYSSISHNNQEPFQEPFVVASIDHSRSIPNTTDLPQVDGSADLLLPSCNNPLTYVCALCSLAFTSAVLLSSHLKNTHTGLPSAFKCDICGIMCGHKNDFLDHMETSHSSDQNLHLIIMYKCLTCEYETWNEDDLKQHIENIHIQSLVVACEYCDLSFNDSRNLNNHISFTKTLAHIRTFLKLMAPIKNCMSFPTSYLLAPVLLLRTRSTK